MIILTSGVNEYFSSISIQLLVPKLIMIKVNIIQEGFPQPFMNSRIAFLDLVFFGLQFIFIFYQTARVHILKNI